MKHARAFSVSSFIRVIVVLALIAAPTLFYRQTAAASDELEYFHGCVSQEIPAALARFVSVGGNESLIRAKADIVNSVFSLCRQRATDSSHRVGEQSYVDNAIEALFKQIEQQQQIEQRWKADPATALEDQAVRAYSICLQGTARKLSRVSGDPTDAIEHGSLAECAANRQAVFDVFSSHGKSYSPEAMTALEQEFHRKLPDVVTKTRSDMRRGTHQ